MAFYRYVAEDGDSFEVEQSMHDAPPLGHKKRRGGKTYKRVLSDFQPSVSGDRHFVSHSLPLHWPAHDRHDAKGRCLFNSQREVDEAVARSGDIGDPVGWD